MRVDPYVGAAFGASLLATGGVLAPASAVEIDNGRLVFVGEDGDSWGRIYTMAPDGTDVVALTGSSEVANGPEYSPDGRRIAYSSSRDAYSNIYVMDAGGTDVERLTTTTFAEGGDMEPTWSPDGMRLVFTSTRDVGGETPGGFELYSMAADGSEQTRLTTTAANVDDQQPSISPDGARVAFVSDRAAPEYDFTDLFVLDLNTGATQRLTFDAEPDGERFGHYINDPVWSPDGTRLLFSSDRSGNRDIWVIDADGTDLTNLTDHPDEDSDPAWSPDGTAITWTSTRSGQYDVWSMPVQAPTGRVGADRVATSASDSEPVNLTPADDVTGSQVDWQAKALCSVVGTPGRDVLVGTSGADVICGFGGRDVLRAKGGDDVLRGGRGADTLRGGIGADNALGGIGPDRLLLSDRSEANDQGDGNSGVDSCALDPRDLAYHCE